jgi:uncharacterized membrane protein
MENSSIHSAVPKWLIYSILAVSFTGFLDTVFLSAKYYSGTLLSCYLFTGCEKVTTSSYATVLGVPVALAGTLFYLTVLILALLAIILKSRVLLTTLSYILPIGFIASLWFVFLQLFVLKAICQYCMASAITSTLLFIFSLFMVKYRKRVRM